jgi:hypothetical protein
VPKVRTDFDTTDITSVFVEGMGWMDIKPGTLTELPSEDSIAFIDDEGDQVNVMGDRLIASACRPLPDTNPADEAYDVSRNGDSF